MQRPAGAGEAVERAATAIRDHDLAAVRRYLAAGGDPNATDAEGEILLNKAVLHGSPEIMEALLAAGADPDQPGRNGLSPLTIAALAGRQAMLERLMQANATEPAARVAGYAPATGSGRGSASSSGASDVTSPVLASLAGDGEPQTLLPAEPYASMAGLAINPIARPAPGSPPAASPAASPAALPAGGAAAAPQSVPQGGAAPVGSTASDAATAGGAPTPWVTAAQKRLGQLGYYKGPITGFAGSLTADAVKRYQAVAGLPQDGIVSADLLRRIGAVVEAPGAPASAPAAAAPPTPPATAAPAGGAEAERARAAGQSQGPRPAAGSQRAGARVQQRHPCRRIAPALPGEHERLGLRRGGWTVAVLPRRSRRAAAVGAPPLPPQAASSGFPSIRFMSISGGRTAFRCRPA